MNIRIMLLRQLIHCVLFGSCIIMARAQGGGQPIPAYLLSDLPNLKAPYPSHFMLVDQGKEGLFRLDNNDTSTPDNIGTVLVAGGNKRYKRAYKGMIEVEWFGAKGSANNSEAVANSIAIQAACDWAALSSGARTDQTLMPVNKDRPAVVHIPAGTYFIAKTINLRGAINIKGDGGMSFGGTALVTRNPGHLFSLAGAPETDASNAVEIHDMRILMAGSSTESSAIYSGSPPNSSYSSLRVEGVWFQLNGQAQHAYEGLRADDVKFTNCTFDGTIAVALILGSNKDATNLVSNFSVQNCTFFWSRGGIISARNVEGLLFSGNRVYGTVGDGPPVYETPFVVDALTNSRKAERIQIIGNNFDRTNKILITQYDGPLVIGNTARHCTGRMVEFRTNRTIQNARISDNIFSGKWSGMVLLNGVKVPNAAIAAYDATLANSEFRNTIVDESGTSTKAYYIPKTGTPYNVIDSKVIGFSAPYEVGNPANNLYSALPNPPNKAVAQTSKARVQASAAPASTAAQPSKVLAPDAEGKLTPAYSMSFTTAGWSTSTYTQVVEPAMLTDATIYLVKAVYNKVGLDVIVQSWLVPITTTYPNSSAPVDLMSNTAVYGGNTGHFIKLRQKRGTITNTTFGLEAALSTANMAASDAKLEISITPLF